MLRGACHCTAIRFEIARLPDWVLDCNCTLCRRYGAIWAYPERGDVTFVGGPIATGRSLPHGIATGRSLPHGSTPGRSLPHGSTTGRSLPPGDATDRYVWGDRMLAFHRCAICGCVTHMTALDTEPATVYGINARMIPTLDPASVRLRQKDNGHTGFFWTRSAAPPEPSAHPPMPPPSPDDWR